MSAHIPDPDPEPALRPVPPTAAATGVPPGETPPGESSTGTGAGPYRPLTRGWGMGPLVVICLLAFACALFFLAYAVFLDL
ncbi:MULTISPECIES: DUF6480 family protein [unclassified Streptomyces]|uniref:DUF6480 family protein n=1 Tax=unclassified Streptomyces TaxID=2593676 RepID=UPI00364DD438